MTMVQNPALALRRLLTALVMGCFLFLSALPAQDVGETPDLTSSASQPVAMSRDIEAEIDLLVSGLPTLPVARANTKFDGELNLNDMTVADFISLLSEKEFLNINVILGASDAALSSPVNVKLTDITMGEAFNLVLQFNRLRAVHFNRNTFIIIEDNDQRTFGVKARKVFRLTYVSTEAVIQFIQDNQNLANLMDLDNIIQDTTNNSLLIIDSPDRIQLLKHVISLLDSKPNKITVRIPVSHIGIEDITSAIGNLPAEVQARLNTNEMIFSEQGRTLIVYDTAEDVALLRDIIRQIDIGLKQVLIDVSIMEVSETVARNIGLKLQRDSIQLTSLDKIWNLDRIRSDLANTGGTGGTTGATATNPTPVQLTYQLQRQGGNTIANPKIRVVDGEAATINVGQVRNVRVQTSQFAGNTTGGTQSTTFNTQEVPIGVTLSATPEIHNDGTVTLQLDIQDEEIISISDFGVDRTTRNSTTTLRIRDGETVILGGFINRNISYDKTPIPILGQLPLLKKIFRTNSRSKIGSELIILLTPYILDYDPVMPRTEVEVIPPGKPITAKNYGFSDSASNEAKVKTTTTRWSESDNARTKVIYDAQGEIIYQRTFPKEGSAETPPIKSSSAGDIAVPPPLAPAPNAPATPEDRKDFADLQRETLQPPSMRQTDRADFSDLRKQVLQPPESSTPPPATDGANEDWGSLMGELGSLAGGG
jgi:type II secretory pathway component GspD/PulD (secretin)